LREAKRDDLPVIMELEHEGFKDGVREERKTFEERLTCFPEGFFVLTVPGELAPIGYICAEIWRSMPEKGDFGPFTLDHSLAQSHDKGGDTIYISSQTVHPEFRGAALGEFMFRRCIEEIYGSHPRLKNCLLLVNEDWHGARKIYVRCGFKTREIVSDFFVDNGVASRAGEVMERPLPLDWANPSATTKVT
jgi:ribosomal-protein-alanine N-acetyltransferase